MLMIDEELDVRNVNCPLPVMRTKQRLKHLDVGQCIKVIATDPASADDMKTLCKRPGMELDESRHENGNYIFIVKNTCE